MCKRYFPYWNLLFLFVWPLVHIHARKTKHLRKKRTRNKVPQSVLMWLWPFWVYITIWRVMSVFSLYVNAIRKDLAANRPKLKRDKIASSPTIPWKKGKKPQSFLSWRENLIHAHKALFTEWHHDLLKSHLVDLYPNITLESEWINVCLQVILQESVESKWKYQERLLIKNRSVYKKEFRMHIFCTDYGEKCLKERKVLHFIGSRKNGH